MVAATKESPADYTSSGYEKVRTTLLQQKKTHIEKDLQPIKKSWKTLGLTIVLDGWKDTRNRPLINVIVVSPKGAMFLKAIDCEGQVKDSEFISRILIEAIEMVGSENVVQVVTDNAKNCRGAGALVESWYEHIFWTPCTVHSLNLIMQRIGTEVEWVKKIYEEGEDIQVFVTNRHMSQSIFRTYSKLELLKVASSSVAEMNWSTYSFIHSVKRNRLGSKKVEDLVFVHTNLCLLSRKNDHYKEGATKLWDVAPECADFDVTLHDLIIVGNGDDDSVARGASSISGTMFCSNDLSAVGDDDDNVDFLVNPYDSESDFDAS